MYRPTLSILLLAALCRCASAPAPLEGPAAVNTRSPSDVVQAHLRTIEAGDWATAQSQLASDFSMQMKGMPFFAKIDVDHALDMHKARKRAFPDFRFNEKIESVQGNAVKIAVYLTGTHTGFLDYPIDAVPKLEATGKAIDLPAEYFTYYVEHDTIRRVFGEIPPGHGPPALKKQLGVE